MEGGGVGRQAGQRADRRRQCISVYQTASQTEEIVLVETPHPSEEEGVQEEEQTPGHFSSLTLLLLVEIGTIGIFTQIGGKVIKDTKKICRRPGFNEMASGLKKKKKRKKK